MKASHVAFFVLTFILALSVIESSCVPETKAASYVAISLILRVRNYADDMPISNTSITATVTLPDRGQKQVPLTATNATGVIQVSLGSILRPSPIRQPVLLQISLSNNYTLIKIQDRMLEDLAYIADYIPNVARYTDGLSINLDYEDLGTQFIIEGDIWVLSGKLVKISDVDPISGDAASLSVKPGVKSTITNVLSDYEGYYFLPLKYGLVISPSINPKTYQQMAVEVNETTTLINWMYYSAKGYADSETASIEKEMAWLDSAGYPIQQETAEYQAIKDLLNRALTLYQEEEYGSALGGAKRSAETLDKLSSWIGYLKDLTVASSIGICFFVYGLASLISIFAIEEPSQNKTRLTLKVIIFSLFMLLFSVTNPSLKIFYAILVGSNSIDLPVSLFGAFVLGSVALFVVELISIKKAPMTDLAIQLGVRSLKRRLSRTILTLVTITIIVSAAMVFVNISVSRATRIIRTWEGSDLDGILVTPDGINYPTPLSDYDIEWTRKQEWFEDLGHIRKIWESGDVTPEGDITRLGFISMDSTQTHIKLAAIDPAFFEEYYNLPDYVRGDWQAFSAGDPVAIVSSSLGVPVGGYIKIIVNEYIVRPGSDHQELLGIKSLGQFRVVGTIEPIGFSALTRIDNDPLFGNPHDLVLLPLQTVTDLSVFISEVTVILREGYDVEEVAEEMTYTFGLPVIANKDGISKQIEWGFEYSAIGLLPYMPPLAIACMMVYVTMASVFEERKRELSTLATLGLDPKNTFQVFLVEALLLGLMGTFIGFFGSYLLTIVLSFATSLLGGAGAPAFSLPYANWSMVSILVALFTGVVMVFLGGYIPAVRAQGLSLMGRAKKRQMIGELVHEGNMVSYALPIRDNIRNGEMMYTYIRETIGKIQSPKVDPPSVKGEIHRGGTFKVSFVTSGPRQSVFNIPFEIRGEKTGEVLTPVLRFPETYKRYSEIRGMLSGLEKSILGFTTWRDMQLKMQIIREAPKKQKSVEEILTEIQTVISQIKDSNKKLKILEEQKAKLSEEIYSEFREKYKAMIEEKSKQVRTAVIGLESYSSELQDEIKKLDVEIERITIAHSLGEINEEEYVKTCGPLQGRVAMLKSKVAELEEIFEFLEKPKGII